MSEQISLRSRYSGPHRHEPWIASSWLRGLLITVLLASWAVAALSAADPVYWLSQAMFAASTYASLYMLAKRPLLNPAQAVVFLFYWLFGLAPVVSGGFELAFGDSQAAANLQDAATGPLLFVAAGLPLYAAAAAGAISFGRRWNFAISFIQPQGRNYSFALVASAAFAGLAASSFLSQLAASDTGALSESNYLGGITVEAWWAGPILVLPLLTSLANSSLMTELVAPSRMRDSRLVVLAIAMLVLGALAAVTSGWKGAFIVLFLYLACAYTSRYQRPPLAAIVVGVIVFAVLVEPFVSYGRGVAELENARSASERERIFTDALSKTGDYVPSDLGEIRVRRLFRGIVPVAGEILHQSGMLQGAWEVDTVVWGLLTLVPRSLFPDKPALSVGNYIAATIGFSLGDIAADDSETNLSPTIIFEIAGNYGWLYGLLAFPVIGFVWSLLWVVVLSVRRFESHPLTPYAVIYSLHLEAPFGHFMTPLKNLFVLLFLLYGSFVVYRLFVASLAHISRSNPVN